MASNQMFFCFFLIALCNINLGEGIVCPPNICATVSCEDINKCEVNQVLKPGGFCDCCNQCVTILGENQTCGTPLQGILMGAPAPTAECDKGLACLEGICRKIIVS